MRRLGKVSLALVVLAGSACQMYEPRAPKLKDPKAVPRPKGWEEQQKAEEKERLARAEIETCDVRWGTPTPPPTGKQASQATAKAAEHERIGDTKSDLFTRADTNDSKSQALVDAIDEYGRALATDPYNPTLTLKLADAYDRAYRKGCALVLLGRLAKLSDNPKFSAKTNPVIDEVVDRKSYFPRYRNAAIKAVGR